MVSSKVLVIIATKESFQWLEDEKSVMAVIIKFDGPALEVSDIIVERENVV